MKKTLLLLAAWLTCLPCPADDKVAEGWSAYRSHDFATAERCYKEALTQVPPDDSTQVRHVMSRLAVLFFHMNLGPEESLTRLSGNAVESRCLLECLNEQYPKDSEHGQQVRKLLGLPNTPQPSTTPKQQTAAVKPSLPVAKAAEEIGVAMPRDVAMAIYEEVKKDVYEKACQACGEDESVRPRPISVDAFAFRKAKQTSLTVVLPLEGLYSKSTISLSVIIGGDSSIRQITCSRGFGELNKRGEQKKAELKEQRENLEKEAQATRAQEEEARKPKARFSYPEPVVEGPSYPASKTQRWQGRDYGTFGH